MASHAAKYGPNGALAFRTSPEGTDIVAEQSTTASSSRHSGRQAQSSPAPQMQRLASISSNPADATLRKDYEMILARFDDFCACNESSGSSNSKSKSKVVHSDECSLLDDYLDLSAQHELPFRVWSLYRRPAFGPMSAQKQDGLVTQCLLVSGQAAIDGLNPKFKGKASKQTLALQQKALGAMQKLIAKRPNTIDDNLVLASAVLMAIAVRIKAPTLTDLQPLTSHRPSLTTQTLIKHTNRVCRR